MLRPMDVILVLLFVKEGQEKREEGERREGKKEGKGKGKRGASPWGWSLTKLVITQPFPVPTLQVSLPWVFSPSEDHLYP